MSKYRIVQVSNRGFYIEEMFILFLWIRVWVRHGSCYSYFEEAERVVNSLINENPFKPKVIKYYP